MTELSYLVMLLKNELCCVDKKECKPTYDRCSVCPRSCNIPYDTNPDIALFLVSDMHRIDGHNAVWKVNISFNTATQCTVTVVYGDTIRTPRRVSCLIYDLPEVICKMFLATTKEFMKDTPIEMLECGQWKQIEIEKE